MKSDTTWLNWRTTKRNRMSLHVNTIANKSLFINPGLQLQPWVKCAIRTTLRFEPIEEQKPLDKDQDQHMVYIWIKKSRIPFRPWVNRVGYTSPSIVTLPSPLGAPSASQSVVHSSLFTSTNPSHRRLSYSLSSPHSLDCCLSSPFMLRASGLPHDPYCLLHDLLENRAPCFCSHFSLHEPL